MRDAGRASILMEGGVLTAPFVSFLSDCIIELGDYNSSHRCCTAGRCGIARPGRGSCAQGNLTGFDLAVRFRFCGFGALGNDDRLDVT